MKKVILFATILFAGVSMVNAQGKNPVSAETKLTVKLSRIQHIAVNGPVVLDYSSLGVYQDGAEHQINNHLTVNSTGGYAITVGAEAFGPTNKKIDLTSIKLTPGEDGTLGSKTFELGTTAIPTQIITNTTGAFEKTYDMFYKGGADLSYIQYALSEEGIAEYTTVVTYTIATN